MHKSIIYFHPTPIEKNGRSADKIRPLKMLNAFKELGYEVDEATGYVKDRKARIKQIRQKIKKGKVYDFCYGEFTTEPTLLSEPHHLPVAPFMDFSFLKYLKQHRIKTGVFHRDSYWKFPLYKTQLGLIKSSVGILFHNYDLKRYPKALDILFLPDLAMIELHPQLKNKIAIHALPPGCEPQVITSKTSAVTKKLQLFYTGGITPPVYDLTPLFKIAGLLEDFIDVQIVCRQEEWQKTKDFYQPLSPNLRIDHVMGVETQNFFEQSDIFAMLRSPDIYLKYATPFKLFEALGYHKPVLTLLGTLTADIVQQEQTGWVVPDIEAAARLLKQLYYDRDALLQKERFIQSIAEQHSWLSRAKNVAFLLGKGL